MVSSVVAAFSSIASHPSIKAVHTAFGFQVDGFFKLFRGYSVNLRNPTEQELANYQSTLKAEVAKSDDDLRNYLKFAVSQLFRVFLIGAARGANYQLAAITRVAAAAIREARDLMQGNGIDTNRFAAEVALGGLEFLGFGQLLLIPHALVTLGRILAEYHPSLTPNPAR